MDNNLLALTIFEAMLFQLFNKHPDLSVEPDDPSQSVAIRTAILVFTLMASESHSKTVQEGIQLARESPSRSEQPGNRNGITQAEFTRLAAWAVYLSERFPLRQPLGASPEDQSITLGLCIEFTFLYIIPVVPNSLRWIMDIPSLLLLLTRFWLDDTSAGGLRDRVIRQGSYISPIMLVVGHSDLSNKHLQHWLKVAGGYEAVIPVVLQLWTTKHNNFDAGVILAENLNFLNF